MANVINWMLYETTPQPRVPVVERTSGLFWRDDSTGAVKLIKMTGAVELAGPGAGSGAGQIFPVKQDR